MAESRRTKSRRKLAGNQNIRDDIEFMIIQIVIKRRGQMRRPEARGVAWNRGVREDDMDSRIVQIIKNKQQHAMIR